VTRRLARFVYETWARSQIRGTVEPGVQFIGFITVEGSGNVHIGSGTRLGRRTFLETHEDGVIRIGRHCTINDGTTIVSYAQVSIGDYALVGEYATIRDADHGTALADGPMRFQAHHSAAVRIGDDAWIGRGACVLKGASIGDGAIVGANSVVTKDVESRAVAVGAPAKAIGVRPE
jgi:acetyltransferase-like isoleucine patch superfamily enzyme